MSRFLPNDRFAIANHQICRPARQVTPTCKTTPLYPVKAPLFKRFFRPRPPWGASPPFELGTFMLERLAGGRLASVPRMVGLPDFPCGRASSPSAPRARQAHSGGTACTECPPYRGRGSGEGLPGGTAGTAASRFSRRLELLDFLELLERPRPPFSELGTFMLERLASPPFGFRPAHGRPPGLPMR